MINWNIPKEDSDLATKVGQRASAMAKDAGVDYGVLEAAMDVSATHGNGCPLKLQELLDADDLNFAHDVFGMRAHINRQTGKLGDCFIPRYAAPASVMPRIDPHATVLKQDEQLRRQLAWLKRYGFKDCRQAQEAGY